MKATVLLSQISSKPHFENQRDEDIIKAITDKNLKSLKAIPGSLSINADTHSSDGCMIQEYGLSKAIEVSTPEIVEHLLAAGANANAEIHDRYEQSSHIYPLMSAFYHNRPEIANTLIEHGAKFSTEDLCEDFALEEQEGELPKGYTPVEKRIKNVLKGLTKENLIEFSKGIQKGSSPIISKPSKKEALNRPIDRFCNLLRDLVESEHKSRGMKLTYQKTIKKEKVPSHPDWNH